VVDERCPGGYPTAAEAANRDTVYVGRIREDMSSERGLNLWIVADNVRKGAATNSVQIAEILAQEHL
jgi:aspartate-semialdehyde dehydrogenase